MARPASLPHPGLSTASAERRPLPGLPPARGAPPSPSPLSSATGARPGRSASTTAGVAFYCPSRWPLRPSHCCQNKGSDPASPPKLLPRPLPLPLTVSLASRALPLTGCRCPSPLPCRSSASCPRPRGSCGAASTPPAGLPQSTSSAGLPPSGATPAWPRTPGRRSPASALLPSPIPKPLSSADHISSAPPPQQNSPPRRPAGTACSLPSWGEPRSVRYPDNTRRQSPHRETGVADAEPDSRRSSLAPHDPRTAGPRRTPGLAGSISPSWSVLLPLSRLFPPRRGLAFQLLTLRQTHQ